MSKDRSARLQSLFSALVDTPADARLSLLEGLRAEDADLARELAELLAHDRQIGALDTPPVILANSLGYEKLSETIGPYRLVRRLGSGGFASVYEAVQDQPIRQRVALKVLRQDLMGTEAAIRFRIEQQALARLTHPGVARVLATGEAPSGQPYTAMEFVDGLPIDEFVQTHGLDWHARVRLCLRVVEAVASLHESGVIHRDLKPSNVLVGWVDQEPAPKLIDLGIAKLLEPERDSLVLSTREQTVLGTPEYMSPEQLDGKLGIIGTRSDVYALGVLCWEVLSLEWSRGHARPVAERVAASTDRVGRHRRFKAPARWRDLKPIVAKATARRPEDRYDSAGALAHDIENAVARRPIAASPPSVWATLWLLALRHRATSVGVGVLLVMLVLFALYQSREASVQRSLRVRAEAAELTARSQLEQLDRQVRTTQAINDFLTEDLLRSPDPAIQARDVKVADVLARSAAAAPQRFQDSPTALAGVLRAIGVSYYALGLWKESLEQLTKAEALLAPVASTSSWQGDTDALDTLRGEKADALFATGDLAGSEAVWLACREYRTRNRGADDPSTIRTARRLAEIWSVQGRHEQAMAISEEVYEAVLRRSGADSEDAMSALNSLAVAQMAAGDARQALDSLMKVLKWYTQTFGDDHPSTLTLLNNVGRAALDAGEVELARSVDAELVERRTRVLGAGHPNTRMAMILLGNDLLLSGRTDEAVPLIEQSVDVLLRTEGADSWTGLLVRTRRAALWIAAGRSRDAKALMDEVLTVGRAVWANAPLQIASAHYVRGLASLGMGEFNDAEADFNAALTLAGGAGLRHPRLQRVYAALGMLREAQGRRADADDLYSRAGVWQTLTKRLVPEGSAPGGGQ